MTRRASIFALALALGAASAAAPKRIVSLSPNLTEMMYGIGAFGQLVAVSDYSAYPEEAKNLPSIGRWPNPDLEKLTALRPDLVLSDDAQAPFVRNNIEKLHLKLLIVPTHTVSDVYTALEMLGKATGHPDEAARLAATTRAGLQRVAQKTAGLPKLKVVLVVSRLPGSLRDMYTATAGSYLAELVEIAGGQTPLPRGANGYAKLSKEDLLAADPDVIIDFAHNTPGKLAGDALEPWTEMPQLKAVRERRVASAGEDYVPHATQRMVETAELFARLIHPEAQ